jgi:iron complex outermembrane receptor protein
MKRIAILIIAAIVGNAVFGQTKDSTKRDSFLLLEPVEIKAIRAGENSPFTKTNLTKKQIEKVNLGQDLPFILNQTPSVVVNSDAGNGVGYTGIRIRGSDASRINVTLNGVPFNDAESQGTFFVDLPDISSSVGSIQVQRGVGTSSNGAGAFGASINISTNEVNLKPYAEFNNSYGSFNTWKNTIKVGSGLVGDHFTMDLRLSKISSDGYIDRASSDLRSFYFSTAYLGKKNSLRFNMFSGKEKTYQAWYGVTQTDLETNRTVNYAGMERPGEPYDNETDNYKQDHYQLFFNQELTNRLKFSAGLFYIKGKGYYEQYKADQAYADYGLPEPINGTDTITNSDLVRQLWLDNDFYGSIFSLQYKTDNSQFTFGGGWNRYEGNHYGDVVWAEKGLALPGRWYDLDANKNDLTLYFKQQTKIGSLCLFFMICNIGE